MNSAHYEAMRKTGYLMAGAPGDLERRAWVYHQLYRDSGKRHVFALIAAHGALWAAGYFHKGQLAGRLLSLGFLLTPQRRRARLASLARFADRIRDINRRVCAESHAIYHYTKRHGSDAFIRGVIGDDFADILDACHASNRDDTPFGPALREQLLRAFFSWEQDHIVAPAVTLAFDEFDWPLVKRLALRTELAFTYFENGFRVRFDDFSSTAERIMRGLQVYRQAEDAGLDQVEAALQRYRRIGPISRRSSSPIVLDLAPQPK